MNIYKIVLTGGPCAGKTTIINNITNLLKNSGYYVITIEESARTLMKRNMLPIGSYEHTLNFQEIVLRYQMTKEQGANIYANSLISTNSNLLQNKKGIIILHDRGTMDNRAYLSHEDYTNLLAKFNLFEYDLVNNYDLIIDLISIATTNPELYVQDTERYETPEQAAKRDEITSSACLLHPNLITIKPTKQIEEKSLLVYEAIINFIEKNKTNELKTYEIIEEQSDLSKLNNDNSRKIKLTSFHIKDNSKKYILNKKEYQNHTSFIINSPNNKPELINNETYQKLLTLNLLEQFYSSYITYFINKGNYYQLEITNNNMYLKTNSNIIPENIVLKKTLKK